MKRPTETSPESIAASLAELQRDLQAAAQGTMDRLDLSPETVEQGLAKLVLGLVDMLRQLLERQAIRRMEGGSLTPEQEEALGLALMRLEQKILELAGHFGLRPEDLDLRLGLGGFSGGGDEDR